MGEFTTLMARDGHEFNAWLAAPQRARARRGGHRPGNFRREPSHPRRRGRIRRRGLRHDRALFVRSHPPRHRARVLARRKPRKAAVIACRSRRRRRCSISPHRSTSSNTPGRVAVVGYCWGGTLAYLAACELPVACAVSYYGGQIKDHLAKSPRRPVMYHFGEQDPYIPAVRHREDPRRATPTACSTSIRPIMASIARSAAATTPPARSLARERTLAFLTAQMEKQMIKLKDPSLWKERGFIAGAWARRRFRR